MSFFDTTRLIAIEKGTARVSTEEEQQSLEQRLEEEPKRAVKNFHWSATCRKARSQHLKRRDTGHGKLRGRVENFSPSAPASGLIGHGLQNGTATVQMDGRS